MLKVGITGGIGSGKTIVCQVFHTLGIPVFYADDAAKYLMEHDETLINDIKTLFGNNIYANKTLNRKELSGIVFKDPKKLQQLNALVHPATVQYARDWMEKQQSPYAIKEAAIFFESGTYVDMDIMIGVSAPLELRIQRAIARSSATREEILDRISKQMDQDEKMNSCDYVIINDEVQPIIPQVLNLHQILLEKTIATR
ncbi:MAG: dephospho-CoA kinase [Flavipsychrobacter sp.]